MLDAFLARLVFPFCDLVCLFVDYLGGDADVRTLLQWWTAFGRTATTHRHHSRLLLISESDEPTIMAPEPNQMHGTRVPSHRSHIFTCDRKRSMWHLWVLIHCQPKYDIVRRGHYCEIV